MESPFFIEATKETIDSKLIEAGIFGGNKLPPPYVGVSKDGRIWEMFTSKQGKKSGWMIHDSGRKIKPEKIDYYLNQ